MKIFWVVGSISGRCFYRMTREKAQGDVNYRNRDKDDLDPFQNTSWKVEEEEVPDERFGVCINEDKPMLPECPECSVGMVRKHRNGVEKDDGACRTCPYFEINKAIPDAVSEV